jgi:transposase
MIYDTQEEVERKTKRDLAAMEARRRKGMALLKKGYSQAEVARAVGVSRMTVMRWERLRMKKAKGAWKCRKLGRPTKARARYLRRIPATVNYHVQGEVVADNVWTFSGATQVLELDYNLQVQPLPLENVSPGMVWSTTAPSVREDQCL